jgi:hypothetical protein
MTAPHNLANDLAYADFPSAWRMAKTPEGYHLGGGKTVGNGLENWAPNALFIHSDGSGSVRWYKNTGTSTTATWTSTNVIPVGQTLTLQDTVKLYLGTGLDIEVEWNGTYLESGPISGMWTACPSVIDPDPSKFYCLFDDFMKLDTTDDWTEDVVGTGTQTIVDDVAGGELLLTCQATTDDACEQATYVAAPFLLAAGKTLWYEARVKQTGDVQSEVSFGLVALGENLTAVADVYPQDGISFAHQDASMALALTCSKNGTNTGAVAGVHTMVTGTYATYGLLIDGVTSVTPYINGTAGTAATATINDDESMAPYFLVRNGDGVTQQKLSIDYVKVVQLR